MVPRVSRWQHHRALSLLAPLLMWLLLGEPALAQAPEPPAHDATEEGRIERVTVYPQRAAVTRAIRRSLDQGLWTIRVTHLPEGIDPATLQAKVQSSTPGANAPRLLGVEYGQTESVGFGGTPEGVALAQRIEEAKRELAHIAADAALLEAQSRLADQVGARAVANATAEGATAKQELDRTAKVLEWVRNEKGRMLTQQRARAERERQQQRALAVLEAAFAQKGGASRVERTAMVQIAVPEHCEAEIEVTYIVSRAAWAPTYSIRAAGDRSAITLEYDAVVSQATGEDWTGVEMALCTAEPARAAAPPSVAPAYVDLWSPPPPPPGRPMGPGRARNAAAEPAAAPAEKAWDSKRKDLADRNRGEDAKLGLQIEALGGAAAIGDAGIATTFAIPRRASVPSDAAKTQRTRIGTIEPSVQFVYGAQPLVTEAVFLRGDLNNTSAFTLLPGDAQIFMGGDFIGQTRMPMVAPQSDFQVYFGPDRAVRARREVVQRNTGSTGLFGGSIATTWKYRVTIDNGSGREIALELLDRRPVSRNEKIEVKLADLSAPLSINATYLATRQPQGILRWDLQVPPTARNPNPLAVTWSVQATRPKDVQTTPLPD